MFHTVFQSVLSILRSVIDWFSDITDALPGSFGIFMGMFFVVTVGRLLLFPLVGFSGRSWHEGLKGDRNE